ncbi:hypothetical protein [Metallibacterium scheffleri]|nr:hypothetical protein [Metallibacterium scheffleri]
MITLRKAAQVMHKPPQNANESRFLLACRHADYAGEPLDFAEIAHGAPHQIRGKGAAKWLGGFRGRPVLALQLREAISLHFGANKPHAFARRIASFRGLWRLFDRLENAGLEPIEALADVEMAHGSLWLRSEQPPAYSDYATARIALETARELAGLDPLAWMTLRKTEKKLGDVATREQAHRIYHALKRRVYATYDRWRNADELAASGRNLLEVPKEERCPHSGVTAADLHATYRALITASGNPVPSAADLLVALGHEPFTKYGRKRALGSVYSLRGTGISDLIAGLYPTQSVLQDFFHLFLIQTGWNPQVLLDIDVSTAAWATRIGRPEADIYRLISFKVRSGEWQTTICRGKPSHFPYQLITRLHERTRPLRNGIAAGLIPCSKPKIAHRSPWLYVLSLRGISVELLHEKNYHPDTAHRDSSYLSTLVDELNRSDRAKYEMQCHEAKEAHEAAPEPPVPIGNVTASDFRDIYIGNEFLQSGYNLVIAKLAAGHSNMSSIRRYLATRAWRRHSEASVRKLMDHLWGEIETHRICDPAILRALCDRGVITEQQRERWARGKDKTYLGMGCVNSMNPPKYIDPTNDGTHPCRNQHRCTICERGIVLPESLTDLCKREAEIESLRIAMSLVAWERSEDLQDEEFRLHGTLAQFDQIERASHLEHWRKEILAGRHQPLEWEGMHVAG